MSNSFPANQKHDLNLDQEHDDQEEVPPSSPEGSVIEIPSSFLIQRLRSVKDAEPEVIVIPDDSLGTLANQSNASELYQGEKSSSLIEISQSDFHPKIISQVADSPLPIHTLQSYISSTQAQSPRASPSGSSFTVPAPPTQNASPKVDTPSKMFNNRYTEDDDKVQVISSSPLKNAQLLVNSANSSPLRSSPLKRLREEAYDPQTPTRKRTRPLLHKDDILPIQTMQSFDILNSSPLTTTTFQEKQPPYQYNLAGTLDNRGPESVYHTARENQTSPFKDSFNEPVPEFETKVSRFEFHGKVTMGLPKAGDTFTARIFSSGSKKNRGINHIDYEEISDSEAGGGDDDLSIIEIVKTVRKKTESTELHDQSLSMSIDYDLNQLNQDELDELKELDTVEIMTSFTKNYPEQDDDEDLTLQRAKSSRTRKTDPLFLLSSPEAPVKSNQTSQIQPSLIAQSTYSKSQTQNLVTTQSQILESDEEDDLSKLTTNEVKTLIIQYGLKPQRSKTQMIATIRDIQSQLSQTTMSQIHPMASQTQPEPSQSVPQSQSQFTQQQLSIKETKSLIKKDITASINASLPLGTLQDILIFKPIKLSTLLKHCLTTMNDMKVKESLIREWSDLQGVCLIDDVNTPVGASAASSQAG
ncbi:hypothetical protein WICPIJ_004753 [Wickerhamomyces pijperi]|uniref:Structure-specific endonuclease subunit SLX4 n=1 Tax=Wickerhamomyces pijperi TaxID=599730 RepID=A0A9P8Q547_WICPI|nr:hypothetical protein WICPIJ_004753 [Wickerhamomyces pijperi]